MHYVAICLDRPDSHALRLTHRTAHLDYLRVHADAIKSCGPFLSDDGAAMVGSLLIVEAKNRAKVDEVLAQDPYRKAGLFGSVEVRRWRWVIGCPIN